MSRSFAQFRYYSENNENVADTSEFVSNITLEGLKLDDGDKSIVGKLVENDSGAKIYRLGIQSLPGCKFYLNKGGTDTAIYVGNTGIFELNFEGSGQTINNIRFDENWLDRVFGNSPIPGAYLIVDVAYEISNSSYQQFLQGEEDETA